MPVINLLWELTSTASLDDLPRGSFAASWTPSRYSNHVTVTVGEVRSSACRQPFNLSLSSGIGQQYFKTQLFSFSTYFCKISSLAPQHLPAFSSIVVRAQPAPTPSRHGLLSGSRHGQLEDGGHALLPTLHVCSQAAMVGHILFCSFRVAADGKIGFKFALLWLNLDPIDCTRIWLERS